MMAKDCAAPRSIKQICAKSEEKKGKQRDKYLRECRQFSMNTVEMRRKDVADQKTSTAL